MKLLAPDEFDAALRDVGAKRYHHRHPFHRLLHQGGCSLGQVQAWALNRYCYQAIIPLKDAALIARCDDPAVRRIWRGRLVDQDGDDADEGGIARWLRLTDALKLDRDYVVSQQGALPATRFAAESYLHFVRERSLIEAIASSLTELFAPAIIGERVEGMLKHYHFVPAEALAYFRERPRQATRDTEFALSYVKAHATTPEAQGQVLSALAFKCDMLWAMLDALYAAYVAPAHAPPGAFAPPE